MTLQRAALWAIVVAATVYLLVAGRGLMLPFVLGLALWYMVDALADAFEQPWPGPGRVVRLPRPVALVAAVLVMGGLLWVLFKRNYFMRRSRAFCTETTAETRLSATKLSHRRILAFIQLQHSVCRRQPHSVTGACARLSEDRVRG